MHFRNPFPLIWFCCTISNTTGPSMASDTMKWRMQFLHKIICINELIRDRCCCGTISMSRIHLALPFVSFSFQSAFFRQTKTNKVLGFSVWLIFFSSFFPFEAKTYFGRLLYQSQSSLRPHKPRRCVFMRIKAKNCVHLRFRSIKWFDHWLNPSRTTMKFRKRLFWCGLRVFHSLLSFF